ncbi:MAG TPA: dCTP deaminase [Polyangiaceae bacterium]|nr:dCTP deaminase [Polyangiaceae bacterium]
MILSDRDLRARIEAGDIVIEPLDDPEVQIQPASIDLRLDRHFLVFRPAHVECLDPREKNLDATSPIEVPEGEAFLLDPGDFVLGATLETIRVPDDLVARVEGRSSLGRLAIVVHATAGFIDPGFEGQVTLELSNLGRCPVKLYPGMRVSQIVFHELTSPAERPYGQSRGSKYQGQRGPVASRMEGDRRLTPSHLPRPTPSSIPRKR